jgi:Ferritin-like
MLQVANENQVSPGITHVSSRSELLTLLSEACELEHGLACSYLYSAFTLKRDLSEGGLTWQQLQLVRKWAGQIYFVASQEMLHLAQVWNLLTAIGGMPYYYRPNFPQASKYYSFGLPLLLEPFGRPALQRFRYYERPLDISPTRGFLQELDLSRIDVQVEYRTIGELYGIILEAFQTLPERQLFIGNVSAQIGPELADFPDIVKVIDRASAAEAIKRITHQGEGTLTDRADCHFGMFTAMKEELEATQLTDREFRPARDSIHNPATKSRGDYGAEQQNVIEDPYTQQVSALFDDVYVLMLRMLAYVFTTGAISSALIQRLSALAIGMMPSVILPLGEALTMLPAGQAYGHKTAGPTFGLTRHVMLPPDPAAAAVVVKERITEILATAQTLAMDPRAPQQLQYSIQNLRALAS